MHLPLKSASRLLLLALLIGAAGCGKKDKDAAESEPAPANKPKVDQPAQRPSPKPEQPGTPKDKQPTPPTPKGLPKDAVEVRFTGDDFDDVNVGDGVLLHSTCAGREEGRVLLAHDARRHSGKRPAISAPELHATYAKNAAAADKRYKAKGVIVRGVVVGKERGKLLLSPTEEPKSIKPDAWADLATIKPDFTLTAEEFYPEFRGFDPSKVKPGDPNPREKYQGKVIELTGKVVRFNSERGRASLTLYADTSPTKDVREVLCHTRDDEPWAKVVPGQRVTLRGVAPKALSSAWLVNCIIVSSEPAKGIIASAPELVTEYKASRDAANEKYKGKLIYVTGEVASNTVATDGAVRMYLKTGEGLPKLLVEFKIENEYHLASDLKPGAKVRACCKFYGNYDPAEVKLAAPMFIFK